MTTTTLSTPAESHLPKLDWPFLIAAVLAAAVLVALVTLDGHPASAALILGGFALGVAFLKTDSPSPPRGGVFSLPARPADCLQPSC